ncbi:MAG: Gfo/Idh/MocA family oxidoreductase [Rhodobacteraceae bacterium]|nr:Gfo/Idh/MocA family oxidoreductase [Paracoccaceae bacterium]
MKPVRWGVLGAAKFAREHMAPAIHAANGAELVALATSDPAKSAGFVGFCPGLVVHASYDALLADASIEAVYIPLPNHLHVEWTLTALAAGKHVLTEKPLALRAPQIDQIIAARDASGLLAAEAFMIVHHPQWHRAKDWLAAGEIGQLRHVDAAFSYNNADPGNIRNRADTGGGSLRDIGVYTLGSMRFVTGAEPAELTARVILEAGVEVFAQLAGVMAGPSGRFTFGSMTSMRLANRQEVVFQGDKGMIRLGSAPFNANLHDVAQVELHKPGMRVITDRFPAANHYVLQVEAFCRSLRNGVPYPCPLEFSRGTQAMIDMAHDAAVEVHL